MKRLVIPDGGRKGALITTENGVRSIQPFNPHILHLLKAGASLVKASTSAGESKDSRAVARHSLTIVNLTVQEIEQAIGPLDADASILYYDDDGGFSCGSTGRLPVPFPWPPSPIPSIQDLLAAGVVEPELIDYLEQGRASGLALRRMFEQPEEVARELHIKLSEKSVADLKQLDPSSVVTIKDPTDREILEFFHKVVADGRFIQTWFSKPYEISHALEVELSDAAIERLLAGGALVSHGPNGGGPVADFGVSVITVSVADAVIVYIVATKSRPIEEVVQDLSEIDKV
jgi:hypothetical protein